MRKWTSFLILGLAILSVATTFWALSEKRKTERFYSIFFDWSYDLPRNLVITRWKDSGDLVDVGHDRNADFAEDSLVTYGTDNRITSVWVDEDHNGIWEVQYVYSKAGIVVAKYEDIGQDGFFEEYIHFTADSAFTYRDANEDGNFALNELVRSEARASP